MNNPIVKIINLTKIHSSLEIIKDLSLEINVGKIFALLGPDGSGKTTLVELLLGILKPNAGEIFIFSKNIRNQPALREIKKRVGVLPQEFQTYNKLTVRENILFWGRMYEKMIDPDELLSIMNLEEEQNIRFGKLPHNVKQRVGLAIAFVNDPDLVILDEPTAGLDLYTKKQIWDILKSFNKKGKTIFLTTNHVLEPQAIADKVAIIHQGIIKDIGSPGELIERFEGEHTITVRCPNSDVTQTAFTALDNYNPKMNSQGDIVIITEERSLMEILSILEKKKIEYSDIITQKTTLNEVFLELTGKSLDYNI
jgi:ABC-2 type transport system ATP-binding protein